MGNAPQDHLVHGTQGGGLRLWSLSSRRKGLETAWFKNARFRVTVGFFSAGHDRARVVAGLSEAGRCRITGVTDPGRARFCRRAPIPRDGTASGSGPVSFDWRSIAVGPCRAHDPQSCTASCLRQGAVGVTISIRGASLCFRAIATRGVRKTGSRTISSWRPGKAPGEAKMHVPPPSGLWRRESRIRHCRRFVRQLVVGFSVPRGSWLD
jgi:hypothetical protein